MALFNRKVTVTKDTNVHPRYPDWYDGGKTTLTTQGGTTPTHNLLRAKYASRPSFGDSKLHSAKLLIYPTSLAVTSEYQREVSRYKIYKLKDQFDNEGSLDAHTTDVLAFASHPASSVKFKEEKFTGQDIDGDGVADLGETLIVRGGRAIQYSQKYITLDDAVRLKDGIFDSFWGGRNIMDKAYAIDNEGERIIRLRNSSIRGRYAAMQNDTIYADTFTADYLMGHLSFDKDELESKGVIKYLKSSTTMGQNTIRHIANVATSDTTLFNKVRHSEAKYIGKRESN